MLWAVADRLGHVPLATGNKSELSIGSAALFGDMAGAFAPIKDCPKTLRLPARGDPQRARRR